MDFVKKKAFEAQLKKVGKDLGLGSNPISGLSRSNEPARESSWNVFSTRNDNDDSHQRNVDEEVLSMSPAVINYFESLPKNFPPVFRLFYVNRDILSDPAKSPVSEAFGVLCATESLLLFNTVVAVLFTILENGNDWEFLLVSALMTLLITVYQLITYDIAFRGAYQTSTRLRKQYIGLAGINIVVMALYAFLGVGFFNGWMRIGYLDKDSGKAEDLNHPKLRQILAGLEAFSWTALIFVNIHSLYEYYHLVRGRHQGLTPEAIAEANEGRGHGAGSSNSNDVILPEGAESRARGGRSANGQIQDIKDRYRTEQV